MLWTASKIFWILAQPLTLVGLCLVLGLVLLVVLRRKRFGGLFILLGLGLLALAGFTNIGALLLLPLENHHPRPTAFPDNASGVIVLGGGTVNSVSTARQTYTLSDAGERYVEALRLAQAHPDVPLLVSGGVGVLLADRETDAQSVKRMFDGFALGTAQVRYEPFSRNTYENARNSAALLDPQPDAPYVLITSAYHMPRAVKLFQKARFTVVPWPVDFRTKGNDVFALSIIDAAGNLSRASLAMREWVGLFVYWLTGRIDSPLP